MRLWKLRAGRSSVTDLGEWMWFTGTASGPDEKLGLAGCRLNTTHASGEARVHVPAGLDGGNVELA